ncbi:MAG TPA: hypothetical protein VFU49_03280 [Ktedonobacteraceae bacterium]|nr:hypothetical protein [Ktedonobacteraceae bacterium]
MITCNHCGNAVPDGVKNCQKCGWPLKAMDGGSSPRAKAQEQSALPAWLESLRAGERSPAPANTGSKFPTADLIDEGALPGWMRSEKSGASDVTGPKAAQLASSPSQPVRDNSGIQTSGLLAQSLIDERSLPSWMREGKPSAGELAGQASAQGSKNLPASSLVQPEAMPDWLKTLQPQSAPPNSQPTPAVTPVAPAQPPTRSSEPMAPPPQGFSPRELIDESMLPSWMAPQTGAQATGTSANARSMKQPEQPAQLGGLSGSSLLDVSSLPPWMREGERGQTNGAGVPAAQSSSWQQPVQTPPASAQGVPGASFLDMNALPEWLRSAAGSEVPTNSSRPGTYAGPPRVENMRVPSRPRHEMSPSESSEVAANVFASMLGVAPAAPQFPAPPANSAYMPQSLSPLGPMPGATPEPVPGTPPRPAGVPPQGYSQPGMGYNSGYLGNSQPGYPPSGGPQYPSGAPGMPPMSPASPPYMPSTPGVSGEQRVNKPKRGLVEALRDLLFR